MALLKHQLEVWLGKEFEGIAAITLAEIRGEKLQEFIDNNNGPQEIVATGKRVNELFHRTVSKTA